MNYTCITGGNPLTARRQRPARGITANTGQIGVNNSLPCPSGGTFRAEQSSVSRSLGPFFTSDSLQPNPAVAGSHWWHHWWNHWWKSLMELLMEVTDESQSLWKVTDEFGSKTWNRTPPLKRKKKKVLSNKSLENCVTQRGIEQRLFSTSLSTQKTNMEIVSRKGLKELMNSEGNQ